MSLSYDSNQMLKPRNFLDQIDTDSESQTPSSNRSDGVYLFVSFDLANSTAFKYNSKNWSIELKNHIQNLILASSTLVDDNTQVSVYRIIGDEVIFEIPVASTDSIISILDQVQVIVTNFLNRISGDKESNQTSDKNIKLGIQATVWLTSVNEKSADKLITQFIDYSPTAENVITGDYIGVDMDLGFRLREFRTASLIQITPDIARLIQEESKNLTDRLFVIGDFETAKSNNDAEFLKQHLPERYPKICYFNPVIGKCNFSDFCKDNSILNLENESITYAIDSPLFDSYMNSDFIKRQNDRARETLEICNGNESLTANKTDHLQLHLVAVCIDRKNNRILSFRRSDSHKHSKNKLDFGCIRASSSKTISEVLTERYERDFGVKINLVMDPDRHDRQPVPLAVYELTRDDNFKKGIIFMAEIDEDFDVESFQDSGDYSQAVWIDENNLNSLASESAIDDFEITCQTVFKYFAGGEPDGKYN